MMEEKSLYVVKVAPGLEYECIAPDNQLYAIHDMVVICCERFTDIGMIVKLVDFPSDEALQHHIDATDEEDYHNRKIEGNHRPTIERLATDEELADMKKLQEKTEPYLKTASEMATRNQLDMKFISVHYSFDKKLMIFQFVSEGRVDFRQLLRDLSENIHSRVELRQVGVRDETTIIGGIAPCGRNLCCSGFIKNFVSINVKMAKEQGLSLNPSNISGVCSRLKCCLAFEYEAYKERRLEEQKAAEKRPPQTGCGHCSHAKHNKGGCKHKCNGK